MVLRTDHHTVNEELLSEHTEKLIMKLTTELVPSPCFYSNLRNQVTRSVWDKLRKQVYAQYNYQCGICQASNVTLDCHEIWEYDDVSHIQRLTGFIALCKMCHHCKHMGHSGILASQGKLDITQVEEHFMRVNECTYREKCHYYTVSSSKKWRAISLLTL